MTDSCYGHYNHVLQFLCHCNDDVIVFCGIGIYMINFILWIKFNFKSFQGT